MDEARESQGKLVEAAFRLAALRGWRVLSMREIAAEAGVPLAEAYRRCPSRAAILDALTRRVDEAVIDGALADEGLMEQGPRDRLFDLLMRRFEAMAPYREGLSVVAHEMGGDPAFVACRGVIMMRSMDLMLEIAGLSAPGFQGGLRAAGLAAVYARAMRTWFSDDSEDLSRTMAALDRHLRQADRAARFVCRDRGPRRRGRFADAGEVGPEVAGNPSAP